MKMPENQLPGTPVIDEVSAVLNAEADVLFTNQRLARQHARILERVDEATRPGHVIAFPNAGVPRPSLRVRPGMRWVAGAAAAGLFIGVVAGQFVHSLPGVGTRLAPQAAVRAGDDAGDTAALQAVSTTMSEEEFLGAVEIAIETTGGSALRALNDLTPMVWEVAAK